MDFITSVVVFAVVFAVIMFAWNYTVQKNAEKNTFKELQNKGLVVSDVLIRVPGNPQNWNDDNVKSIGLAVRENVLNKSKVKEFVLMDYGKARAMLGLGNSDFYFRMEYLNGSLIEYEGVTLEKGVYPTGNTTIVPVERTVLFGDRIAKFLLVLYS